MPVSVCEKIEAFDHTLITNEQTVLLQTYRNWGNTHPIHDGDWEGNVVRGLSLLAEYGVQGEQVRKIPEISVPYRDVSDLTGFDSPLECEGLITTNPNHILRANVADCGQLAVSGFGVGVETNVIGLFHSGRKNVERSVYLRGLEYMCEKFGIDPKTLIVQMTASAKADSYKFEDISDEQKKSPRWSEFLHYKDGFWHVDLHNLTIQDLENFGIPPESISASMVDTIADPNFFSYTNRANGQTPGCNGVFFGLRTTD